MWAGWALLVAASTAGWFVIGDAREMLPATAGGWVAASWPIVLGGILALLVSAWRRRSPRADSFTVPPGDLLVPLLALARAAAGSKPDGHGRRRGTPGTAPSRWRTPPCRRGPGWPAPNLR